MNVSNGGYYQLYACCNPLLFSLTVANLYPKWAGCWLSNNVKSIFTMYEDEMILDGDKFNRREFVEKCAIATQGVGNVYAVRMRLCYVGNISSAYDYNSTGASDLCDRHGRTSGRGYDIYFHSNGELFGFDK